MAAKFYFTNNAAAATPSTFHGTWTATASAVTKQLGQVAGGTAATVGIADTSSSTTYTQCLGRWISDPLEQNVTFTSGTDTFEAIMGVQSSVTASMVTVIHIWVWQGGTA